MGRPRWGAPAQRRSRRPVPRVGVDPADAAALLWELTRHLLLWYFETLSRVGEVYGSLTTAIVILLSLELAAIVLLLGAQVIAEFERLERPGRKAAEPKPMRTDQAR